MYRKCKRDKPKEKTMKDSNIVNKEKKQFKFSAKYIVWLIAIVFLVTAIVVLTKVVKMGVLPTGYVAAAIAVLAVILILDIIGARKVWSGVITSIISIVLIAAMIIGVIAINKVDQTVDIVTDKGTEEKTEMVVAVLADSDVEKITDLKELLIGYLNDYDAEASQKVMDEIDDSVGGTANYNAFDDKFAMVDALYNQTIKAMIFNKANIEVIKDAEGYEDFEDKVKIIYSSELVKYIEIVDKTDSNLDQFVVYVSGIDTFGDVSVRSRSDVNILAVVNTKTKHIQLINTPRDYYIEHPQSNGVKDKLTHAGLYGVENSIGALESLYGINIDYYVRMNFSGFENIIDAMGGIDVYSDKDFTVEPVKHYTVGVNHLSGIEALAFARERHAFAAGDIQRGQNQMNVIIAMINKLSSKDVLYNYSEVLDGIAGTFQTDMTSDDIYTLVKRQLIDNTKYTIDSYSVTGNGDSCTTYSTPKTKVWVMQPNMDEVENAKKLINNVLNEK